MGLHPNLRLPELEVDFRVHLSGRVWEQVQLLSHTRVLVGKREDAQAHLCRAGLASGLVPTWEQVCREETLGSLSLAFETSYQAHA